MFQLNLMQALSNNRISRFYKSLFYLALIVLFFLHLSHPKFVYSEETKVSTIQVSTIKEAGLSWGRKYFFDAPRFKDHNIQEQLNASIEEKLNSYGIQISEGNSSSKYVLNYTIVLEESASQLEIEDLYEHEPELKDSSDDALNFEHGRFIISIRDRNTRKAVWKNNAEGLAVLEMDSQLREQRTNALVDEVFANFPTQ